MSAARHRAERAPRAPRRLPGRLPRLSRRPGTLLLAGAVGLVVGSGGVPGVGTLASWNDAATIGTGSLVAGVLDLQLDGTNAAGIGTPYAKPGIAFADRAPGETEAYALGLRNAGNPPGTWTLTVARGSTWTYGDDAIRVQAFTGTVVEDTDYPIVDTCTGQPLGASQLLSDATARTLVTTPRRLGAGASETICLTVGLDAGAGNANQGKAGTVRLDATLTQAPS